VENAPDKTHAEKYTGNTPRFLFLRAAAHQHTAGSAKRNPQSEVLVCWFCLVVFNAV
jgi:hypothetical protein